MPAVKLATLVNPPDHYISFGKNSAIFKHLQRHPNCKKACGVDCFSVLDMSSTPYQLKIKEALHIAKQQPCLNVQSKSVQVTMVM